MTSRRYCKFGMARQVGKVRAQQSSRAITLGPARIIRAYVEQTRAYTCVLCGQVAESQCTRAPFVR